MKFQNNWQIKRLWQKPQLTYPQSATRAFKSSGSLSKSFSSHVLDNFISDSLASCHCEYSVCQCKYEKSNKQIAKSSSIGQPNENETNQIIQCLLERLNRYSEMVNSLSSQKEQFELSMNQTNACLQQQSSIICLKFGESALSLVKQYFQMNLTICELQLDHQTCVQMLSDIRDELVIVQRTIEHYDLQQHESLLKQCSDFNRHPKRCFCPMSKPSKYSWWPLSPKSPSSAQSNKLKRKSCCFHSLWKSKNSSSYQPKPVEPRQPAIWSIAKWNCSDVSANICEDIIKQMKYKMRSLCQQVVLSEEQFRKTEQKLKNYSDQLDLFWFSNQKELMMVAPFCKDYFDSSLSEHILKQNLNYLSIKVEMYREQYSKTMKDLHLVSCFIRSQSSHSTESLQS